MNNLESEKNLKDAIQKGEKRKQIIQSVDNLIREWPALDLASDKTEKRDSIINDVPLLEKQDRELCIKELAEAGIVKYKETYEKVKERARILGIDKEEMPIINYAPNLSALSPAQHFSDDIAYFAIPVKVLKSNRLEITNFLITSEGQKILLCEEEVIKLGFYLERSPYLLPRWSERGINTFLNNDGGAGIAEVFNDIYKLIKGYIDFGNDIWAKYISLWIIGTYFHRLFETYPYIHLNGDMESGKTKTLMFTAWLAFNAELTFNSSPSYVVRAVHNNHSTCCIDEAEGLKHSDDQDCKLLVSMYNSGYKKGSFCGKSEQLEKNGQWIPKQFEAYAPKIFASIRGLEASLNSRCIPIIMLKTGNREIKNRELDSNDQNFTRIRDKLYYTALTYFIPIRASYKTISDEEVLGREWELWRPILAIAKVIDSDKEVNLNLYSEIRAHALEIQKLKKEARKEETPIPKVLVALKEAITPIVYSRPDNFWSTTELLDFLRNSEEEAFSWLNDEKKHGKGRWLGDILRTAGIVGDRAKQKRIGDKNVKGFYISLDKIEEKLGNYD
ncbi:MAG: hypothetical protein PHE30_02440 [Candidatus Omnitrophica bacterium]|nr:hypothetical protein [Candidatus Omnitrophota bacterium]